MQKYFPQMQPNPMIIDEWWSYRYLLAQLPHQNQPHTIPSSAYPEGVPPPTITIPQIDGQPQLIEGMSMEDEQQFVDTLNLIRDHYWFLQLTGKAIGGRIYPGRVEFDPTVDPPLTHDGYHRRYDHVNHPIGASAIPDEHKADEGRPPVLPWIGEDFYPIFRHLPPVHLAKYYSRHTVTQTADGMYIQLHCSNEACMTSMTPAVCAVSRCAAKAGRPYWPPDTHAHPLNVKPMPST